MALTSEDLQAIKLLLQPLVFEIHDMKAEIKDIKTDIQGMKDEIKGMKDEIRDIKTDMQGMKDEIKDLKEHVTEVDQKLTETRLHLENHTDKNVQLLAENFINLTRKLNEAIPASDKLLAYEIKVDYCVDEVKKLKMLIQN